MALKSTSDRYGTVAISIHWLATLLIVVVLVTGFRSAGTDDVATRLTALRIHLPAAALVLVLTAMRIVWWLGFDQKPDPIAGSAPMQERVARAVHLLLYVVVLGMVASGVGMMVLSGAAPIIFGADSVSLADFWRYPPRVPHGLGARLMVALLVFHVAAALYHHYLRRDPSLRRIWFTE
jgi:cytochrome b561